MPADIGALHCSLALDRLANTLPQRCRAGYVREEIGILNNILLLQSSVIPGGLHGQIVRNPVVKHAKAAADDGLSRPIAL